MRMLAVINLNFVVTYLCVRTMEFPLGKGNRHLWYKYVNNELIDLILTSPIFCAQPQNFEYDLQTEERMVIYFKVNF